MGMRSRVRGACELELRVKGRVRRATGLVMLSLEASVLFGMLIVTTDSCLFLLDLPSSSWMTQKHIPGQSLFHPQYLCPSDAK